MRYLIIFFCAVLCAFALCVTQAEVPKLINYQGKLTTSADAPVNDTLQMVFTIYDADVGGNVLWTETQPAVTVDKGVFNVLLGNVNPIPYSVFDGSARYLGVKVGGDPEITPRKAIVSVAYAYKSFETDTADYARAGAGGGGDHDWVFPTSAGGTNPRPYLYTYGPWGIARYGNILYGNADSTHVNQGVACTTGTSGYNLKYCTVGGGFGNTASGSSDYGYTTVGGGEKNTASGEWATIGGGRFNAASGVYTTVGGGAFNTAIQNATVGGGYQNRAAHDWTTIGGGNTNTASGQCATIGGGGQNTASGTQATVGGGIYNTATGLRSMVGGGWYNNASGDYATIPGGDADTVAGDYSFAAGRLVRITSTADYTFAFGNNFTTSASHAVIFHDSDMPIKVGIGTTSPNTRVDIDGDVALRAGSFTAVNEYNHNILIGQRSFVRITGPTTAFTITGIAGGQDGKMVILYNATAQNMTIENESVYSNAANRILTMGADETTTGTGNVTLIYDATAQRWIVTAIKP